VSRRLPGHLLLWLSASSRILFAIRRAQPSLLLDLPSPLPFSCPRANSARLPFLDSVEINPRGPAPDLHPTDAALLQPPEAFLSPNDPSQSADVTGHVSWLRKTEYIQNKDKSTSSALKTYASSISRHSPSQLIRVENGWQQGGLTAFLVYWNLLASSDQNNSTGRWLVSCV
jgi:hypothetical protein